MGGKYEAELNRIRSLSDSIIPKTSALLNALTSLDRALSTIRLSDSWRGGAAEAASADIDEIRRKFGAVRDVVEAIDSAVGEGNSARRTAASAELPSASIDPFWANAAKGVSFVIHPVLGPLAADTALDAIGDFLGGQREEAARKAVENVAKALEEPTKKLETASRELSRTAYTSNDESRVDGPGDGSQVDAPRLVSPGVGGRPSGHTPGIGGYPPPSGGLTEYQPPVPGNPQPTNPVHPEFPVYPDGPDTGGWTPDGPGADGPGGSGDEDPSIDSPGGGVLPGGPGGAGGGAGTGGGYPVVPGGSLPGGGTGGGGLGGIVGGGAGAAAIAASSKIAGVGSMGGLGGGLGTASGAGLKAGGGLLGNSALGVGSPGGAAGSGGVGGGGAGIRGAGGVGGAGGAAGTGSSGAAGAGGRTGMGMMGGAGGADEEERKRSGLGGPIAPKLEDEAEAGPRAKGARAGSRRGSVD